MMKAGGVGKGERSTDPAIASTVKIKSGVIRIRMTVMTERS